MSEELLIAVGSEEATLTTAVVVERLAREQAQGVWTSVVVGLETMHLLKYDAFYIIKCPSIFDAAGSP